MRESEELEAALWDGLVRGFLFGDERQDALARIESALVQREAAQGPLHSDLIWALSLKIEILRLEHSREATREAANVGERRLALRRLALRDAPEELLISLRELSQLYTFEYEALDPARVKALEDEIHRLDLS
jgi:hypothetical protein